MEFIISNWYLILGMFSIVVMIGIAVYKFAGLPTKEQLNKIKNWLLYAVIKAEAELGEGVGQLQLRKVYDMFLTKFPITAKLVSFQTFSAWVDLALDEMKNILTENESVKNLVDSQTML